MAAKTTALSFHMDPPTVPVRFSQQVPRKTATDMIISGGHYVPIWHSGIHCPGHRDRWLIIYCCNRFCFYASDDQRPPCWCRWINQVRTPISWPVILLLSLHF